MRLRSWILAVIALSACRTARGPESVAAEYADALESNRLDDAYALLSSAERARVSPQAFRERLGPEAHRLTRAAEVRAALPQLHAAAGDLQVVREGDDWRIVERPPAEAPSAVLSRFLAAAKSRDWAQVYALLSGSLRARYTPERLAADFEREPLAKERLARIESSAGATWQLTPDGAQLPLGGGKAVRLVREQDAYRVAELE